MWSQWSVWQMVSLVNLKHPRCGGQDEISYVRDLLGMVRMWGIEWTVTFLSLGASLAARVCFAHTVAVGNAGEPKSPERRLLVMTDRRWWVNTPVPRSSGGHTLRGMFYTGSQTSPEGLNPSYLLVVSRIPTHPLLYAFSLSILLPCFLVMLPRDCFLNTWLILKSCLRVELLKLKTLSK